MAGKNLAMEKGRSIEGLLLKLKKGQDALRKSIKKMKSLPEHTEGTIHTMDQQGLEKISRESLMKKLDKVADFPRKRARLDQLTVEFEEVGVRGSD